MSKMLEIATKVVDEAISVLALVLLVIIGAALYFGKVADATLGAIRHALNPEAEVRKQLDSATELIFQLVSVIQSQRAELEAK